MDFLCTAKTVIDLASNLITFKNSNSKSPIQSVPILQSKLVRIITDTHKTQLDKLLENYHTVVNAPLGRVKGYHHEIKLLHENPKRFNAYPTTPLKTAKIDEQVDSMLKQGLIRKSSSPYAAPCILRPKPNGDWRFITDFSHVNSLTVDDSFPMVRIQDILKVLGKAKYFSTLDAEKGYWQVPMAESSKKYTAFRTKKGLYEYNVLPFGLKNSPATYQRIMNEVLQGLQEFCLVYQDDIIIFSSSFKDHLKHVSLVLDRFKLANITLKKDKCIFGAQEVKYLGHIISSEGIKVNPDKVKVIQNFESPSTRKKLKQFLGILNFYHHFFPNMGATAEPLYQVCSVKNKFSWGPQQQEAFNTLKNQMCKAISLYYPDFSKPFLLHTDASDYGVSGALSQIDDNNQSRVITFCSKTLNNAQRNYSTVEKELLAIIFSLEKFREYIDGQIVNIFTDNKALSYLHSMKITSQRLTRWAWKIQEYSPHINYIPGESNLVADFLSRNPLPDMTDNERHDEYMFPPLHKSCLGISTGINLDRLREEQDKDLALIKLKDNLLTYFRVNSSIILKVVSDKLLPVIPKSMISDVISFFHESLEGGHLGISKTYKKMKSRVYIPKLHSILVDYIRTCKVCQRVNYDNRKPAGIMSSPEVTAPWSTVHLDLMGPYTKSNPGNYHYIFVVVDYFSKWVEIFPLRQATTKSMVKFLHSDIICRYGAPKSILTDNASYFTSKLFKSTLNSWGISHQLISPYTPQVNLTERVNRTIKSIIRSHIIDQSHTKWATTLPYVQLAINSSFHESTKFTPSEGFLGREIQLSIDNMLDKLPHNFDKEAYSKICNSILQHQTIASRKQASYYNQHHEDVSYQIGDKVLLRNTTLSSKVDGVTAALNPLYGPAVCEIVKKKGNSIFTVKLPNNKLKGPLHITFLRKFNDRNDINDSEILSENVITTSVNDNIDVHVNTTDRSNNDTNLLNNLSNNKITNYNFSNPLPNSTENVSEICMVPVKVEQDFGLNVNQIGSQGPDLSIPVPSTSFPQTRPRRSIPALNYRDKRQYSKKSQ